MNRTLLEADLIRDEGLRLEVYKDSVGLFTIGVGHLLGTEPRMTKITRGEAFALFAADIEEAIANAALFVVNYAELSEARQRVLVNMAFNLGKRLFEFRRFMHAVETGQWALAAMEMKDSKWYTQVKARGERLHDLMLAG